MDGWYLHDVHLHRDELAHVHVPLRDGFGADDERARHRTLEDQLLRDIERGKGGLHHHVVGLVGGDGAHVLRDLPVLVHERLDALEVHQAVRGEVVEAVVALVLSRAVLLPPQGDLDREHAVHPQAAEDRQRDRPLLKVHDEDDADDDTLHQRREEIEEHILDHRVGGLQPAVQRSQHVAHLLLDVPFQVQVHQMAERRLADFDVRGLLHLQVDEGLRLLEPQAEEAEGAVESDVLRRRGVHTGLDGVDRPRDVKRGDDVDALGAG
jgi:hypothetical protein